MLRRYVNPKFFLVITLLFLLGAILVVSYTALSESNIVPLTRIGLSTQAIIMRDLMPGECSAITFTNIVYCPNQGTCNGSNSNDLIFGTAGVDKVQGKKGDDCILGGGANDDINGDEGNDVCIGGPGTNSYTSCEFSSP